MIRVASAGQSENSSYLFFSFFRYFFLTDKRNLVQHEGGAVSMNFPLELLDMKVLFMITEILQIKLFYMRYIGKQCGIEE